MSRSRWLRELLGFAPRKASRSSVKRERTTSPKGRLRLEPLENRVLLSGTILPLDIDLLIGNGQIAKSLSYTEPDGTAVTVSITQGTADLQLSGTNLATSGTTTLKVSGSAQLGKAILSGTTSASSLTITARGGADGLATLGQISGSTPLGTLSAPNVDLTGLGITMTGGGTIGSVTLHDLLNGAPITMPGAAARGVKITAKLIDISSITLGSALTGLTASQWNGGELAAPSVGTISISADTKRSLPGNMGADIMISGVGVAANGKALAGATVAGLVDNCVWRIHGVAGPITVGAAGSGWAASFTGNVGNLTVKGDFDATFSSAGNLGSVSIAGNMDNAMLLAGANLGDDAMPGGSDADADIFAGGKIAAFKVGGNVAASVVAAGVDPVNGVWGDGDDVFPSPAASAVGSFSVLGTIDTSTLSLGSALAGLTASQWNSGELVAPSVGSITISGNTKAGLPGNMGADILISGVGVAAKGKALASATVAGLVDDCVWRIHGVAGPITVGAAGSGWAASFTGNVGNLTVKRDFDATFSSAGNLGNLSISGNMNNALVLAGANLGDDARLGGSGSNADTFGPGAVGTVNIRGQVLHGIIGAGLDPLDGSTCDNDAVAGGPASKVAGLTIGGTASGGSFFAGGQFPSTVRVGGLSIHPCQDSRFLACAPGVIEMARTLVIAATGGTVQLPDGSSASIPAGALDADKYAVLSRLAGMPVNPPSRLVVAVGSSLSLSFLPAPSGVGAALSVAAAGAADQTIHFVQTLGAGTPASAVGSVPMGEMTGSTGQADFGALQGTVDVSGGTAHMDLPVQTVLNDYSNFGAAKINVGLGNLKPTILSQVIPAPEVIWNGHSFVPLTYGALQPGERTLVLVHGMLSSVDNAFGASVAAIMAAGQYDQVVGFNYDWTQHIEDSGTQLAAFLGRLDTAGVTSVDIEAHSEGCPVSLAGAALNEESAHPLEIDNVVLLGGPNMGTPAALGGLGLATSLMAVAANMGMAPVAASLADLINRGMAQDLVPGSDVLQEIRDAFAADCPNTSVFTAAGKAPIPSWLSSLFGGEDNDGMIPVSSALAQGWDLPMREELGVFPVSHIGLEGYPPLIHAVGAAVLKTRVSGLQVSGPGSVDEDGGAGYTATVTYGDGSKKDVTALAKWTLETSSNASLGSDGELTVGALTKDGSAVVKATYGGKSGTEAVALKNIQEVVNLTVAGPASVSENGGAAYTATVTYDDGTTQDVTSSASWSQTSAHAGIDGSGHLSVGALTKDDSTVVTATYGGQSGTEAVALKNIQEVVGLTVTGPASVSENGGASYTATMTCDDGSTQDVTASAKWTQTSSHASISSGGTLTVGALTQDDSTVVTATYEGQSGSEDVALKKASEQVTYVGQFDESFSEQVLDHPELEGDARWVVHTASFGFNMTIVMTPSPAAVGEQEFTIDSVQCSQPYFGALSPVAPLLGSSMILPSPPQDVSTISSGFTISFPSGAWIQGPWQLVAGGMHQSNDNGVISSTSNLPPDQVWEYDGALNQPNTLENTILGVSSGNAQMLQITSRSWTFTKSVL